MNKFEMELNENATKAFFFKHGEKLLVGLGTVLLGGFVYLSLGLTPETQDKPNALRTKVNSAKNRISQGDWEEMKPHRGVINDAEEQFKTYRSAVPDNTFKTHTFTGVRRNSLSTLTDPIVTNPIKPIVDVVRATTVVKNESNSTPVLQNVRTTDAEKMTMNTSAMVAMPGIDSDKAGIKKNNKDFAPKASYFISVRYVLPYRKMVEDFSAKLGGVGDPNSDLKKPIIGYFQVERKQNGGQWEDVSEKLKEQIKKYVTWSPDFVDDKSTEFMITYPIPPMLAEDYSKISSHPDVLMRKEEPKKNGAAGLSTAGRGQGAEDKGSDGSSDPHEVPEFKLVRFVDTDVQPGSSYEYRVRLWYFDPNNPRRKPVKEGDKKQASAQRNAGKSGGAPSIGGGQEQVGGSGDSKKADDEERLKELESTVTRHQISEEVRKRLSDQLKIKRPKEYLIRYRPSDWSPSTGEIKVRAIIGEVVLANASSRNVWKYNDRVGGQNREITVPRGEFTIKALAAQWDDRFGVRVPAMVEDLAVGDLIAGDAQPAVIWDPVTETYRVAYNAQGRTVRKKSEKRTSFYRANSGHVLVDFVGGEVVADVTKARKEEFVSPLEALIVDANGNLKVQTSQNDEAKLVWMTGHVNEEKVAKVEDEKDDTQRGGK